MAHSKLAQNKQKNKRVIQNVLCVGLKQALVKSLKSHLDKHDFVFYSYKEISQAKKVFLKNEISLVLFDQDSNISKGFDFIKKCSKMITHPGVIVLTKNNSAQNIRAIFNLKAQDCLVKPIKTQALLTSIKNSAKDRQASIFGIKDPLTGLYNRYAFKEILRQETERAQRYDRHLSLLMIDVDYFKKINDLFGHLIGDQVLEEIADVLRDSVRKIDVISRFGGEEFAIILPETTIGHATMLAERIRKKIEENNYAYLIKENKLTVSIGISNYHTPGRKSDIVLIHSADKALYAAKKEGRNKVCISVPKKNPQIRP